MFELHTNLSERHGQILKTLTQKDEYGNKRRVLEKALELMDAGKGADIKEIFEVYRIRKSLLELFNFVMINSQLVEGLSKVLLGECSMETVFEKIREYTASESKTAKKVFTSERINSFQAMAKEITFYSKHLNIIGEIHLNEEQLQIFAKLNTFKSIPEIPLEILNTLLETLRYTFDIKLEDKLTPIFTITWIPPENYSKVKEQRNKYINARRDALIARIG